MARQKVEFALSGDRPRSMIERIMRHQRTRPWIKGAAMERGTFIVEVETDQAPPNYDVELMASIEIMYLSDRCKGKFELKN